MKNITNCENISFHSPIQLTMWIKHAFALQSLNAPRWEQTCGRRGQGALNGQTVKPEEETVDIEVNLDH